MSSGVQFTSLYLSLIHILTACHLIADADLALLSDVAADDLAHAGLQLVAVLRGKDLDVHDDAVLAVRHARCV